MKKEIYLVECEELVFFAPAKNIINVFVTKGQLIEMLEGNYKIYQVTLIDEEEYLNGQKESIHDWTKKETAYKFDM